MNRSLRLRLFLVHLVVLTCALGLAALFTAQAERVWLIARGDGQLGRIARLAVAELPACHGDWPACADALGHTLDLRVTLIAADGRVVGDSEVSRERLSALENHASRPEVRAALDGHAGHGTRLSASIGVELLYTAVPVVGVPGVAVLRLAEPLARVGRFDAALWRALWLAAALVLLLAAAVTYWLLGRTTRRIVDLERVARRIGAGETEVRARALPTDEIGRLGAALNDMAGELRSRLGSLQRERDQRELVLAHIGDGVALLDADGTVAHANASLAAVLGLALPPDSGTRFEDVVRVPELADLLSAARSGGSTVERDLRLWSPHERLVRATATPLAGDERAVLLVLRDQSEAERLDRVRRDFVANVSHEVKTPLTSVRGYAETLLEGGLEDPEHREGFVRVIRDQATRLQELVDDLLSLSELERPEARLRVERFDLRALAERQIAALADRAAHAGLVLELLPGEPEWVEGDRARIEQVLANLLDNALKYTERGGVTVTLEGDATHVSCTVQDTGTGIPAEDLDRIFERFYRVDKARSREKGGTGLGLSIVKHIMALHEGRVSVESAPGEGSRFRFTIPRIARTRTG
jgi:two-component system phosphate regulon sensor histidine kinase PhoR